MPNFTITQFIDGDTFVVSRSRNWNNQTGDRVRPAGYDAPEVRTFEAASATDRLRQLIFNKQVELRDAHTIDRGRIVCEVARNLRDYFPTYRT
jgi:endonuclease YncB( thermonuclease family)